MSYVLMAMGIWLVLLLSISMVRIYRPIWLMMRGNYDSAIHALDQSLSSVRLSKRMRGICLYNKALCQQRNGMLSESNDTVKQVTSSELDSNLGAALCGLHGTNLLLQNGDIKTARELLDRCYSQTRLSSFAPTLGYGELLLGNVARADELIATYLDGLSKRKNFSFGSGCFLVTDKVFNQSSCHLFLGFYYLKKADPESAKRHFIEASKSGIENIYSERANEILRTI